jgi:hypothetical protein
MQDDEEYKQSKRWEYFARMSEALAYTCKDYAAVFTPDPEAPPQDGIWALRELPALKAGGNVNLVGSLRIAMNSLRRTY